MAFLNMGCRFGAHVPPGYVHGAPCQATPGHGHADQLVLAGSDDAPTPGQLAQMFNNGLITMSRSSRQVIDQHSDFFRCARAAPAATCRVFAAVSVDAPDAPEYAIVQIAGRPAQTRLQDDHGIALATVSKASIASKQ